ncbi:Thioredoxin-like fold [Cordyceps militaris]|uniref:Thioredoxin-like fold n=1 Tax=Cordyceps militaris TaxID=73501 RepID=A0A2H4SJV9_CORMI|nr:Thioredoxin-like fold [Cordyceps militaris]
MSHHSHANTMSMMRQFTTAHPRLLARISFSHTGGVRLSPTPRAQLFFHPRGGTTTMPLVRLYAHKAPQPPSKMAEAVSKRQAGAAAKPKESPEIPERLLIYHAGTGRTTFLAMLKVTTLFIGVFFCCVAVPSYVQADKPIEETAKIALCGIAPILFITYTTAPFVTHLHIHLPAAARTSRAALERFVRTSLPPTTPLTATTMSVIGKPRYSKLRAGDLVPAASRRRFGLVNYTRDAAAENATRKWYELRAVRQFHIPDGAKTSGKSKGGRNLVEPWIWDAIKERIANRHGMPPPRPPGSTATVI